MSVISRRPFACCCAVLALTAVAAAPAPAVAKKREDPVLATLRAMEAQGRLTAADREARARVYRATRSAGRRADGAERRALLGASDVPRGLARRKLLAARVTPVWLNLQRTYDWLVADDRPVPVSGTRVTFPPSRIQFQFFPDAGWQAHPLANFGRLNAWAVAEEVAPRSLAAYADELGALAVTRRGAPAWEYYFPWDGARPGWVSGMASGTAVSALARVSRRTGDPRFAALAEQSLAVFERPAPWGVRARGAEAHYLLYSGSPRLRVGNGFAQALIGLHEYATITGSPRAQALFAAGERTLASNLGGFDTGAWSRYALRGRESDLHYHRLFTGFLAELCRRLGAAGAPYCATEQHFRAYESQPVVLGTLRLERHGRREWSARVPVSKVSRVTVSAWDGGRMLSARSVSAGRGTVRVLLPRPRRAGTYRIKVEALSLTGVRSTSEGTATIKRRSRR
jgi:hypothetical protein